MTDRGRRLSRLFGLVGLGVRRYRYRLTHARRRFALVSILSIAIPVVLLLLVASVSIGVADVSRAENVDYWIEPTGTDSAVTPIEGPKLSEVHETTERLNDRDDIEYANPVLHEFIVAENEEPVYILTIGIVPDPEYPDVTPVSATPLVDVDEPAIVLSETAATALSATTGDSLELRGIDSSVTIQAVESARVPGFAQVPIGVMPLEDLQALTGNDKYDSANQIAVVAPQADERTENYLDGLYPQTEVSGQGGMGNPTVVEEGLPHAVALAAALTGIVAGGMLIVTSFAFEILAGRREQSILAAVGLSPRSRTILLGVELGMVTICGAILGIALWIVGSVLLNSMTRWQYGVDIVSLDVRIAIVGIVTAFGIALLAFPGLLLATRLRTWSRPA